jgi:Protein of unknown function (DUF4242)
VKRRAPTAFLVEHYWPGITPEGFEAAAERLRQSSAALASTGLHIRFLHSTLVPQDEAAFCVFDAESPAVVEQAYACAGVPYERVLDALEVAVNRDAPSATPADERSIDVSND